MVLVYSKSFGNRGGHSFLVSGKHHGPGNTGGLEGVDAFGRIGLDAVADDDVAQVLAVHSHVDDGSFLLAGVPIGAFGLHQLAVTDGYPFAVHLRHHPVTGGFFDPLHRAVVLLVRIGVFEGHGDGVGGVTLYVGGHMQQLLLVHNFRMHGRYFKHTFGKGSGLVKDHGLHLGKGVQKIGALHQNTLAGCPSKASKEGERDRDDQGAGTGDYKKHKSSVDPGGPFAGNKAGNNGYQNGQGHHNGRIDAGELGNETLALGFGRCGILHQIQDPGGGRLSKGLGGAYAKDAAQIHTAGEDFILLTDAAGNALAGKGHSIQAGTAFHHHAIHRHFLAGLDEDDFSYGHLLGFHRFQFSLPLHVGAVRPDIHQVRNALAAAPFGHLLKELSHLEK